MVAPSVVKIIPERSVILICDLQTRFSMLFIILQYEVSTNSLYDCILGPAVSHFDKVVTTVNKMLKFAKVGCQIALCFIPIC